MHPEDDVKCACKGICAFGPHGDYFNSSDNPRSTVNWFLEATKLHTLVLLRWNNPPLPFRGLPTHRHGNKENPKVPLREITGI